MARLGDLQRSVLPRARIDPAGPLGWEDRTVGWVRLVTSRVPALEALTAGDLAIVPVASLVAIRERGVDALALADELARGAASAVVIVATSPGADAADNGKAVAGVVSGFRSRAAAAGLPVLDLDDADAATLERTVIGYLVNARAELERQAAGLESDLGRIALGDGGPDALAAGIAEFLGRAVAIEARDGEPIAVHAPERPAGAARAAAGYLANRRHVALRVPLPGAAGAGEASGVGSLVLLGEPAVAEIDRVVAERVSGLVALELARRGGRDVPGAALPSDGPPWVVLVARQVRPGDRTAADERQRLRDRLRRLAPARRLGLRGTASSLELRAVAAAGPEDPAGATLARRVAVLLERPVALSRPFRTPEDRPAAEADARDTLHAWERLLEVDPGVAGEQGGARVVRVDRLPVLRLVGGLHNLPDGQRQARALLAPLLRGTEAARTERLRTLRALLDAPGPVEAAARIGVHRNTIAYRVARIEALTGWQLDDPDLRLALSLAVRLVQMDQDGPGLTGSLEA